MPQDKDKLGCCAYAITFRCSLLQGEPARLLTLYSSAKGGQKGLQEWQVSELGAIKSMKGGKQLDIICCYTL